MKKLTLLLLTLSHFAFGQDTTIVGNRIIIIMDKKVVGYELQKVPRSVADTVRVSEAVINNIRTKLGLAANQEGSKSVGFQLIVDQDALTGGSNEDRDYTMGLQASLTWQRRKDGFARWLFRLPSDTPVSKTKYVTFSFSGFTPLNLQYDFVDKTDRPYAALTSLAMSSSYSFKRKRLLIDDLTRTHFFRSTTLVGLMGKGTANLANFIQSGIHSGQRATADDPNDARPNPLGWKYAIGSNAKFPVVANYYADYANDFELLLWEPKTCVMPLKLLLRPSLGIAAGTLYNYGTAGVQAQFGFFSVNAWTGNNDGAIFDLTENPNAWEFSLTGEYFAQYWLHNSTLNGILTERSSDIYHLEYNEMERSTDYFGLGGEVSFKRKFTLGYSKYIRSKVMKSVDRQQVFGRIIVRVNI